ncbi:hypothetical protein QWA68_016275, partial [Fusarium oxysporum]
AWFRSKHSNTILQDLDGVVQKGELLLVLGRPRSGSTTFLKTITGEMRSLELDSASVLHYTGIPHRIMARHFKGELVYNQEVDEHLPYLTVGQMLEFAAAMRTPRARLPHITRKDRIKHVVEVMLSVFGLSHTRNTIYASILEEIEQYQKDFCSKWEATQREFESTRHKLKAKGMLRRATQTVSFPMQAALCARRATQQLWNDKASTLTTLIGEIVIALVVGSVFYGTPETSDAFFSYGSVLFFSVLLNVLMSITDTHNLYKGRSVVRKQASYGFYRPSAEALASVLVDIPVKLVVRTSFNIILYFLSGLATTASQFFIFFLFVFVTTLAMSMVFRTIAAATETLPQAMAISGFLVLALVTYTGFVLPGPDMHPWFK